MTPLSATPPASPSSPIRIQEPEDIQSQSASKSKGAPLVVPTTRSLLTTSSMDRGTLHTNIPPPITYLSDRSTHTSYAFPIEETGHSSVESTASMRTSRGSNTTTPSLSWPHDISMFSELIDEKMLPSINEFEIRENIEDIGRRLDDVVEKSTKSPVAEASIIVNRLTVILVQLIEQYRKLQKEAPKDIGTRIGSLFSKFQFTTLRNYFWRLSGLSDIHCHKEKKESLSYLIRCFENDPVHAVSEAGLIELLANVVHFLEELYQPSSSSTSMTTASQTDIETTKSYLQILTLISEVCAWHNENESKIKFDDQLIARATQVLAIINVRHPEPHSEADKGQWYKAKNIRLQFNIARAALYNLTSDRSTLKNLFVIVSPLTNNAKNFASSRDIVSAVEGAFKTFDNAFDQYQAKMLHSKWYVKLFAIRKALHELSNESDKVKLLQASLKQSVSGDFCWEFVAEVLHLLGRLGLESQNHTLMYSICSGLRAKKDHEERLPGLVHFRFRQIVSSLLRTAFIPESHLNFLAQLAQNYAHSLIQRLPSDKQHEKIIRLLNAWFPSDESTSHVKWDSGLHIDTLARQLESLNDQSKSSDSERKHTAYSLESSPWSALSVDRSQIGKKTVSVDSGDKSQPEPIAQTKQTYSAIHSRETQMKIIQANEPLFLYYHSFKILLQGMLIASGAIEVGMIADARKQQLEKIAAYLMTLSSSLPPTLIKEATKTEVDIREKVIGFFRDIGRGREVHKLAGLFKGRDAQERTDRLAIELTLAQEESLHKIRENNGLPIINVIIRKGRWSSTSLGIFDFSSEVKKKLGHLIDVVKSKVYDNSCDDPIVQKAGIDFTTILGDIAQAEADASSRWTIPDFVSFICGENVQIADPMSPRTELEHAFKQQREAVLKVTKQMETLQAQLGIATTKIDSEALLELSKQMGALITTEILTQKTDHATGAKFAANKQRFESAKTHHQVFVTPIISEEIDASVISDLVERSRQGPVPEASAVIRDISARLDFLIKEYRALQAEEASSAREQQVVQLFLRYHYPTLRHHFWQLSRLSASYCYDEKLKCLSHLMRCLENDPIISLSREGLDQMLRELVNCLEEIFPDSSSTTTPVVISWNEKKLNITQSLLQIFALLLEVRTRHAEKTPTLSLDDSFIKKAHSILGFIGNYISFSREEESSYKLWDAKLCLDSARIALECLSEGHTSLKTLLAAASPLVESIRKGMLQHNTIELMAQLFQVIAKGLHESSIKSLHNRWYVNLFSMRQAIRHIPDDLNRLRLLQASLMLRGVGFPWQFAGSVVHMMGKLGLECQDPKLSDDICYGQKVFEESDTRLPGLIHIQSKQLHIYQSALTSESTHKSQMTYLAQLAKYYGDSITNILPKTLKSMSSAHAKEKEGPASSVRSLWYNKELHEIGEKIGGLIERSRKRTVPEAQEVVSKLSTFLSTLIKEYRALQTDKASPERDEHISALFSNWDFSAMRRYFWQLSHLSARYCYESKLECLSYLRECLENDPIIPQSREGLIELFSDIADHLGTIFPKALSKSDSSSVAKIVRLKSNIEEEESSVRITKELLRVLKLISEVWSWHREKLPTMNIAVSVINKMEKALEAIGIRYLSTENLIYNRLVWDLKLNYELAQAAIKHLSANRYEVNGLSGISSLVIKGANELQFKQDTIPIITQLFQALAKAYSRSPIKSRYEGWYVNLFAVRKAVRQIPSRSDRVKFLQVALLVIGSRMSWQFAGGILEIIGKLGRESKDQKLRYDICMGQKASKEAEGHLPGLIHFHRKLIIVFHSPTELQSICENRVYHLAKLAQHYADMIINGLQPGKEKDQLKKLFGIDNVGQKRHAQLSTLIERRSTESS